jgi:hypothetical protein
VISYSNINIIFIFLPFDKSEITRISKKKFPLDEDSAQQIEFEEKLEDAGSTCFARLSLNHEGHPDFNKISLSTLPWAIRHLNASNITYKD